MPGFIAKAKSMVGSGRVPILTIVASQTNVDLPGDSNVFEWTAGATETIATINANRRIQGGRIIVVFGATASAAVTVTNNAGTTTKGQIDAGAADITIDNDDTMVLVQRRNGTWVELASQNN